MERVTNPHLSPPRRLRGCVAFTLAFLVVVFVDCLGGVRRASAEEGPLAPLDMSSPRATLRSFTATIDRVAANFKDLNRRGVRGENARLIRLGLGCLDLSAIPSSLVETEGREAAVCLKEVLDRIPLPPLDTLPDAAAVKTAGIDRWRLPNTEISLVRLTTGPRAGDFVFSADSVARAEEFFERVRHVPYRPDAGSPGLFDSYVQLGGSMIPEALIRRLPAWAHAMVGGETVWQWMATVLLAAAAAVVVAAAARVRLRSAGDRFEVVEL